MQQAIGKDLYGRPYLMRATAAKLSNNIVMETGNTTDMNNKVYKAFLQMLHGLVKWCRNDIKYPQSIWRSILLIVIVYLRCCSCGQLTQEWNENYHATSIVMDEVRVVDETTDENFVKYFNLKIGDKYWLQRNKLMLVLTGDGFKFPKTQNNIDNGSVGLAKIHALKHKNLMQSLYVAIPFLISGLSHYNPIIAKLYQHCSNELGQSGGLSFMADDVNKIKICVEWFRYDNGDWPWLSTVVHRCFSHGADYSFIYWIRHIGKSFVAVKNKIPNLLDAIKAGIKDEHMPWNLNIDEIDDLDNFYCLTTEYHWRKWCDDIETFMATVKNIDNLTYKQKHTKRKNYAKLNAQCALYSIPIALLHYILDVMHCILRHSITMVKALTILLYCIYRFTIAQVIVVLSHICMVLFVFVSLGFCWCFVCDYFTKMTIYKQVLHQWSTLCVIGWKIINIVMLKNH